MLCPSPHATEWYEQAELEGSVVGRVTASLSPQKHVTVNDKAKHPAKASYIHRKIKQSEGRHRTTADATFYQGQGNPCAGRANQTQQLMTRRIPVIWRSVVS